ncbi:MAG: ROK family protein [Conexibacter sp.]
MTQPASRARHVAGPLVARGPHRRIVQLLAAAPDGLKQRELIAGTGLARSSISLLLADLASVVDVSPDARQTGGRPRRVHRIRADKGVVAGVDVGNYRVHVTLADLTGVPLDDAAPAEQRILQDKTPMIAERTLDATARLIRSELARVGKPLDQLAAVGVSLPGAVPRGARTTIDPSLPLWHSADVPAFLGARLEPGVTVTLEHEATAAMRAERRWGEARTVESALFVEWSSTISAGMLIGGETWRGNRGMAGDLGHICLPLDDTERDLLLPEDKPLHHSCPHCAQMACVAQLAGGLRMAQLFGVGTIEEGDRLLKHDERMRETTQAMARLLGRAIGVAAAVVDPELVIVGGGASPETLGTGYEALCRGALETARPRTPRIELSALGTQAAIRGAIAGAVDEGIVRYLIRVLEQGG